MPLKRVRLNLEVHEHEIFYYYCRCDTPDRPLSGVADSVFPGGSVHGIPYSELQRLGTGEHDVLLDATVACSPGQEPTSWTDDDRVISFLQHMIFMDRHGELAVDELFCEVLLSITPKNVERITSLLPSSQIERLRQYGKGIPAARPERDAMRFSVVSTSFGERRVPDENLVAIREWSVRGSG